MKSQSSFWNFNSLVNYIQQKRKKRTKISTSWKSLVKIFTENSRHNMEGDMEVVWHCLVNLIRGYRPTSNGHLLPIGFTFWEDTSALRSSAFVEISQCSFSAYHNYGKASMECGLFSFLLAGPGQVPRILGCHSVLSLPEAIVWHKSCQSSN